MLPVARETSEEDAEAETAMEPRIFVCETAFFSDWKSDELIARSDHPLPPSPPELHHLSE